MSDPQAPDRNSLETSAQTSFIVSALWASVAYPIVMQNEDKAVNVNNSDVV